MAQWPPSPSVEDEATALSHEHSLNASVKSVDNDNQPALSRGSVDQYPIIIDSPDLSKSETVDMKKEILQDQLVADLSSSDDSASPLTPPPIQRKQEAKSSQTAPTKHNNSSSPDNTLPPKVTVERDVSTRGRPQVYRIQTDVGPDVQSMATGERRKPSPYTFNRSSTFHNFDNTPTKPADTFLSPSNIVTSPGAADRPQRLSRGTTPHRQDRSAQPNYGDKTPTAQNVRSSTLRDSEQSNEKDSKSNSRSDVEQRRRRNSSNINARRSYHEADGWLSPVVNQASPSHSRKESKESVFESSSDEPTRYYVTNSRRSSMRSSRDTRDVRDSLNASLKDEASREQRRLAERSSADERKKMRRRSSHRKERPGMTDLDKEARLEHDPSSATQGYESRQYSYGARDQNQHQLLTPTSSDASRVAMEGYFLDAFKANERKRLSRGHSPRSSGSALCSPFASPPRTPKSERHSRDYFEHYPAAQRPVQQPKISTTDDNYSRDSKAHPRLVAVAATGAAYAARVSEHATEASSGSSSGGAASAPRSRKPSPVQEDFYSSPKPTLLSPSDALHGPHGTLAPTHSGRPVSRGSVTGSVTSIDSSQPYPPQPHAYHQPHTYPHPQAYRHFSYSGAEQPQPWNISSSTSMFNPTQAMTHPPAAGHPVPQARSARTSIVGLEMNLPIGTNWGLPICPRPRPVVGYQDWYTIKKFPVIDICATCMNTIGNTRLSAQFERSPPRPYAPLCAMNNPWIRIAFAQVIRQGRRDLSSVNDVATLPAGKSPCPGQGKDIKKWYQVFDPQTKEFIPDFFVCPACICLVDRVFPDFKHVFERPKNCLNQERSCSLHVNSRHFQSIVERLDRATQHCLRDGLRPDDTEPLIRMVRRAARCQPCTRDELQVSRAWHYHPDALDLTICGECYEDVVEPISDRPIARDITKTLRVVPGSSNNAGISCQLYSDRMRRLFYDAVNNRDFQTLRNEVHKRASAQHRFIYMDKLYQTDMEAGIPRHQELETNRRHWQSLE